MKLNLDKLHHNYMCKMGRHSGRTVDILVDAIHQSDFADPPYSQRNIIIGCYNDTSARVLIDLFIHIAQIMGYNMIRRHSKQRVVDINNTRYMFLSTRGYTNVLDQERTRGINVDTVYFDRSDI